VPKSGSLEHLGAHPGKNYFRNVVVAGWWAA